MVKDLLGQVDDVAASGEVVAPLYFHAGGVVPGEYDFQGILLWLEGEGILGGLEYQAAAIRWQGAGLGSAQAGLDDKEVWWFWFEEAEFGFWITRALRIIDEAGTDDGAAATGDLQGEEVGLYADGVRFRHPRVTRRDWADRRSHPGTGGGIDHGYGWSRGYRAADIRHPWCRRGLGLSYLRLATNGAIVLDPCLV